MSIRIHPLPERDLDAADRIFRIAFGTFLGMPDPMQFAGDTGLVWSRWRTNPESVIGAYDGDRLIGTNFATRWGSFGFFGPLTVLPEYWDKGVAKLLLVDTMKLYDAWGTDLVGLFTFPHSPKHVHLYQKFGFWPQTLTPVMAMPVMARPLPVGATTYSGLAPQARSGALAACRTLVNEVYPGLDLTAEIEAVDRQSLGDTVLLYRETTLKAFAICHAGKGSEGGSDTLYVKFAAVRPGPDAALQFDLLLDACEAIASQRGMKTFLAGTNTARVEAYQLMLKRGFRTTMQGVAMQRPHTAGTLRADCFVLDDWR